MIPAVRSLLSGAGTPNTAQNLALSLTEDIIEPV